MSSRQKDNIETNFIVVPAQFYYRGFKYDLGKMTELKSFLTMTSTSVKLNKSLCQYIQTEAGATVVIIGISLGGWLTNLHRAI